MNGWAWAALALFTGWAVTAFGIRAVLQARRTGDAGFRGISGRPGTASWWAGIAFVLALFGGAAAPIAALAGMPPIPGTDPAWLRWAGLAVAVVGVAATLVAQSAMGPSWRVGVDAAERTDLVTQGLFAHLRNPVFTAMAVTAVGLALMVPNAVAVLALIALVVAVQLQVRIVEEPYLAAVHGALYADYAARAGRFLPGVGRRTA
ncbi:isoprenylcysteine carboxylmethyltransferase family protein [Streptomyces sp. NPDC051211]|uniref:methyltransferase family protein n=1 Tax=Streptomyces sp. NPDC051211 TaxID=3154643 RepID=UPI003450A88C